MKVRIPSDNEIIKYIAENPWSTAAEVAKAFNCYIRCYATGFRPADRIERNIVRLWQKGKLQRRVIPPERLRPNEKSRYEYALSESQTLEQFASTAARQRVKDIEALRKAMGTLPEHQPPREDKIYYGLKHLRVELVDYPKNPYRAIYEIVTSTWSGRRKWWKRWENATVDGRIKVVLAALQRQTLPQCLEAGTFTFKIQGITRSAFDQLARHRHAGIGSVGSRDNNHLDAALVLPKAMKKYHNDIVWWWKQTKDLYQKMVLDGKENWQTARSVLPMSMEWRFTWCLNYRGLQDMCSQRLAFCEQWDTVGAAWTMRHEVEKKFPLLAAFLRPRCDWAKRCVYSQNYSLSELFGCLFAPCGRWPKPKDYIYATFNEACTEIEELEEDLGFHIPRPNEWDKIVEEAIEKDRKYFE